MSVISTISAERTNFSRRLVSMLASSRGLAPSPTSLAREFNQFFGGKSVTVHAARKWLLGESIPTQDKLQALARWLDVPVEWLRYGGEKHSGAETDFSGMDSQPASSVKMDALLRLYMALPHRDRLMAKQFISMLVKQHRQGRRPNAPANERFTLP